MENHGNTIESMRNAIGNSPSRSAPRFLGVNSWRILDEHGIYWAGMGGGAGPAEQSPMCLGILRASLRPRQKLVDPSQTKHPLLVPRMGKAFTRPGPWFFYIVSKGYSRDGIVRIPYGTLVVNMHHVLPLLASFQDVPTCISLCPEKR